MPFAHRALGLTVAAVLAAGIVSAGAHREDRPVEVRTSTQSDDERGGRRTSDVGRATVPPPPEETTTTAAAEAASMTTTTAASRARGTPSTATTTPEERGCVPGTYDRSNGECTLRPITLQGLVTDEAGRPIPGVCVFWLGPPSGQVARTDAAGRYAVTGHLLVMGNAPYHFASCPDLGSDFGYVPTTVTSPAMEPGDTVTLDARLSAGGAILGRVVGTDGAPIPGLCLGVQTVDGSMIYSAASDPQGRFVLRRVAPGRHLLAVGTPSDPACPAPWRGLPQTTGTAVVASGHWSEVTVVVCWRNVMTGACD